MSRLSFIAAWTCGPFTEGRYGLGMKAPCRPSVRFFTIHLSQPLFSIFLWPCFLYVRCFLALIFPLFFISCFRCSLSDHKSECLFLMDFYKQNIRAEGKRRLPTILCIYNFFSLTAGWMTRGFWR
ncbi:hypothetical protein QBC41DRAFT_155784 [Cercophora samala]|uniref:Uncharacterized protein n=1 Tax=Cercophora samala TaxID=330535 RepID=A0AA39Z8J7_9PEZI|nr:hypothetical protein QBC41DRAFT_155784 [Cercophora samala]